MHRIARTLRYLANLDRASQDRTTQATARNNAAEASSALRQRRHERESVDAYLEEQRLPDGVETRRTGHGADHAV
jgi:uncharacterized heparinase superfamily protein